MRTYAFSLHPPTNSNERRRPTRIEAPASAIYILFVWALVLTAIGPPAMAADAPGSEVAKKPREFTVLAVNDVYRLQGVDSGRQGGFPRVRTLRNSLEAEGREVLVLVAGDLLYPSLLSRRFDGAQMVDLLNLLDGDPKEFDDRLFFTFGNHEFDKSKLHHAELLERRILQSQFAWLGSNIRFLSGDDGKPLVDAPGLIGSKLIEVGGVRVGLFSLTTDQKRPAYVLGIGDPIETAREMSRMLRDAGAEVVIALTHMDVARDREVLTTLAGDGPDLIFSGHEHIRIAEKIGDRWLFQAEANGVSAVVATISIESDQPLRVDHRTEHLHDQEPAPDPLLAAREQRWIDAHAILSCPVELGLDPDCLDETIGYTRTDLVADELSIRSRETSLGNWITDQMRSVFAGSGAQVAIINSGSLRLNQTLAAGTPITRRHIAELFAYPAPLRLLRIDGTTLGLIASRAVQESDRYNGWWLQISGFAFRFDPESDRVTDLRLLTDEGPRPIQPDEEILLATTEFLVDPSSGQDGFTMLTPDQVVAEAGDLREVILATLEEFKEQGIAPEREGRICRLEDPGPCLVTPGRN